MLRSDGRAAGGMLPEGGRAGINRVLSGGGLLLRRLRLNGPRLNGLRLRRLGLSGLLPGLGLSGLRGRLSRKAIAAAGAEARAGFQRPAALGTDGRDLRLRCSGVGPGCRDRLAAGCTEPDALFQRSAAMDAK